MGEIMSGIAEQKRALRKAFLVKRRSLDPSYAADADRRILDCLLSLSVYKNAQTVFCYYGVGGEIQTLPFLKRVLEDGKRLALPLCIGKGIMQARQIFSIEETGKGSFGLIEPASDAPLIPAQQIDLAVIPCVCCDHSGNRIGSGGGYYDRYFETLTNISCVMLCREQMICNQIQPVCEAHDIRFTPVITEAGIYR